MTFLQQHLSRLQDCIVDTAVSLNAADFEQESDFLRAFRALEESYTLAGELCDYLLPADETDIVAVIHGGGKTTVEYLDKVVNAAYEAAKADIQSAPLESQCDACPHKNDCTFMSREQEGLDDEDEGDFD